MRSSKLLERHGKRSGAGDGARRRPTSRWGRASSRCGRAGVGLVGGRRPGRSRRTGVDHCWRRHRRRGVVVFTARAIVLKGRKRRATFASSCSGRAPTADDSLRSGYGITQALDSVSEEADDRLAASSPTGVMETRLGRDCPRPCGLWLAACGARISSLGRLGDRHQSGGGRQPPGDPDHRRERPSGSVSASPARSRRSPLRDALGLRILTALPFLMAGSSTSPIPTTSPSSPMVPLLSASRSPPTDDPRHGVGAQDRELDRS